MTDIRGYNNPHYFQNGNRVVVTKDEARLISLDYYKEVFKLKGITLKKTLLPIEKGDFKIIMVIFEGANVQEFKLKYHNGNGLFTITLELPKASSGVSVRELFVALLEKLKTFHFINENDYFFDNIDQNYSCIFTPQSELIEENEEEKVENQSKTIESKIVKNFPQYFQKKYKRNVFFERIASSNQYVVVNLICPINTEIKVYVGMGFTKDIAKNQAIIKAVNDKI